MFSKSRIASPTLLVLALGLAACQDGDDGATGELAQRLATPTTLAVATPGYANISGQVQGGDAVEIGPLSVEGGSIDVQTNANGDIEIRDFVIDLGDIVADDGSLADQPITLTNVKVSLSRALVLHDAWSTTGQSARATVYGEVRLDWSMVGADGQAVALSSEHFTDVLVNVNLRAEDDGSVSAHLSLALTGKVMADWGIELRDFETDVRASDGL
jgi:hypothetical protein